MQGEEDSSSSDGELGHHMLGAPDLDTDSDSDDDDDLVALAVQSVAENAAAKGAALLSMQSFLSSMEPQSQSARMETLNAFSGDDVDRDFRDRFRWHCPRDVEVLAEALRIPQITLPNRGKVEPVTALLTTLGRLSHAGSLSSLKSILPIVPSRVSMTVKEVLEYLERTYWKKLFNGCMALSARYPLYHQACIDKTGVPGLPCIGFIDGTGRDTAHCGNSALQNANHNGYYGGDVLKWHGVQAPDGLWAHFWGPLEGSANDINLVTESELEDKMQEVELLTGRHYCVYGDETYVRSRYIQGGFRRAAGERAPGSAEDAYSKIWNAARTSSEWGYQGITTLFPMLQNLGTQKILQCPIALHYRGAGLLYNYYHCMYGTSVTGSYFDCPAPDLDTYLTGGYFAAPSAFQ